MNINEQQGALVNTKSSINPHTINGGYQREVNGDAGSEGSA